jgi:ribosome-associated protein
VTDAAPRRRTTKTATAPEPSEPSTTPSGDATDVPADGAARKAKVRRADGLPRRGSSSPAAEERSSLDLARRIVELAEDKKAADIVLLDLGPLTTVADYFVICSGGSERQLEAIAGGIISAMRDERVRPFGREGTAASHWILVDFGSVIVHVFTPPERDFYQLERHWSEAKTVLRLQ